jgi:hypothetical protein
MELLVTTEGAFRIHVAIENGIPIVRVSPAPFLFEPEDSKPFASESMVVLRRFRRSIIEVSATATLTSEENALLVEGVLALKAKTGLSVVIVGVPWRSAWVSAGFPVFTSLNGAIDCSSAQLAVKPEQHLTKPTRRPNRSAGRPPTRKPRPAAVARRLSTMLSIAKAVIVALARFVTPS